MDLKQIKLVIDLMKRSDLTEFSVEEEGFKLRICRAANAQPQNGSAGSTAPFAVSSDVGTVPPPLPAPSPLPVNPQAAPTPAATEEGIGYIKSPMVGTFYASPTPEAKSFVQPGANVVESSVVCIIEAMKIMNEIQSETKGTIIQALVENGQPVEYGQKLFKVKLA